MSEEKQAAVKRRVQRRAVVLSANSFWNIVNFRSQLIDALVSTGYPVHIAAPAADGTWSAGRGAKAIHIAIDRSGLNPIVDGALWLNYVRLFRRVKPAFFLGFTPKPNTYGSLAARVTGVISIPNISGLGTPFISGGLLTRFVALLYRLAFRDCPIVFFQNPDDRDLFLSRGIVKASQARLLPGSGVDLLRFSPRPMPADGRPPRFLFIGRLLGEKGVREFVEAARRLKAAHPEWRFELLGELDPENRSGVSAAELGQWTREGLVEHLGGTDDVRPHIAAATAVVLPSYREGLSRSLLEAAAIARPLIATDVPGNRQLVHHGVNGLRCKVRDPQSLADAMAELGSMDPQHRARMGAAGRALVEREYGVDRVVDAYLEALAQLEAGAGVGIP